MTVNQRALGSSPRGGAKAVQKCAAFLFLRFYYNAHYLITSLLKNHRRRVEWLGHLIPFEREEPFVLLQKEVYAERGTSRSEPKLVPRNRERRAKKII